MLYEQFCCFLLIDRWYCGKVNQGLIAESGDTNEILGSYEFEAQGLPIDMIAILCGYHISFCYFFVFGSGEGSSFLCEIENVLHLISHVWTNA